MTRKLTGDAAPIPRESYGPAAARYNAERELGRRALEILRARARYCASGSAWPLPRGNDWCDLDAAASALGLLGSPEEVRP